MRWSAIPSGFREKIIAKVRGGTPLVWIGPWDVDEDLRSQMGLSEADNPLAQSIQATVPLGILPLDREHDKQPSYTRHVGPMEIRTGKLGGGAVVWLDYRDLQTSNPNVNALSWGQFGYAFFYTALTPFVADDDLYYDYYFSILGKALYHATGKTTGIKVRAVQSVVSVEREQSSSSKVSFTLDRGDQELRDGSLVYELRDRHGRVLRKGPIDPRGFSGGAADFAPPLPMLARGTYVVDVWALQRGAVLDWASSALVVTDVKYLEAVEPAKEFFAQKDRIGGTVKFATPLAKDMSVTVELWDTYDRLVAAARLEKGNGAFDFPPIAHPLSRAYRLTAKVEVKDFVLDQMDAWFGLPSKEVEDWQFVVWGWGSPRQLRTLLPQYKQHAVTAIYSASPYGEKWYAEQADCMARNNLRAYPYTTGLGDFKITPTQKFADTLKSYEGIIPTIKANRRYGTMAYSISEENYISKKEESWDNPEALQDYHRYLKERYGEVAKLNEVWGAKFKDFEEISLISFIEAKTRQQPTRWLEQELHKVDRFNQVHEHICQIIQKEDPGARASFDCQEGMDFDWPRMAKIIRAGTQSPLEFFCGSS